MNFNERIFLTGFMGSGKSSCGRILAQQLQYAFTDLDELIEKSSGMTIPELFRNNGKTEFRKLERELLHTTVSPDKAVIATGGGTPCFFDNMDWMLEHGLVIYLRYTAGQLLERLKGTEAGRPVLNEVINRDPVDGIKDLLREREGFYNRAHVAVDVGQRSPSQLSTALVEIVEKWRKPL